MKRSFLFLLTYIQFGLSNTPTHIQFEHLSVDAGLSQRFVLEVVVDCQGFLWAATEDGLNKYDGYNFKVFRHKAGDSTSIGGDILRQALESHAYGEHKLWVCTVDGGLACLDLTTELFTNYRHNPEDSASISNNSVWIVEETFIDDVPEIWVGVIGPSLDRLDPRTGKFRRYTMPSMVTDLFYDSHGILWVGTFSYGLGRYNQDTDDFTFYRHDPDEPESLGAMGTYDMTEDKAGNLWVGTIGSLDLMTLSAEPNQPPKFSHYTNSQEDPHSFSGPSVEFLFEDSKGRLWVSSFGGGQDLFNREENRFIHFDHDPDDPGSMGANTIFSIDEDQSGVLWFGHVNGLSKWDEQKAPFTQYDLTVSKEKFLEGIWVSSVRSSWENGNEILWIGTVGKGFCRFNRTTGEVNWYQHNEQMSNSLASNTVLGIEILNNEYLLILTWGGLSKFHINKRTFENHYLPHDSTTYVEEIMFTAHRGPSGRVWIASIDHLNVFDEKKNRLKKIDNIRCYSVLESTYDKKRYLWGGTFNDGLLRIDLDSEERTWFKHDPENALSLSSNMIDALFQSENRADPELWVGTMNGLNRYDYESGNFQRYTMADGLPHNHVVCITEDLNGDLWITTKLGLSKFNIETETFVTYWKDDGLPGDTYEFESIHVNRNGEVFAGGSEGLVSFFPDSLKWNQKAPKIVLTDFKLMHDKEVSIRASHLPAPEDEFYLAKHISYLDEIQLSHREKIFSIEFSALDFRSPNKNQYAYKLEGFDDEWVSTDYKNRKAVYMNLAPGNYNFRVKGSNNNGVWNEKGASIRIIIQAAWWQTKTAKFIYMLMLISLAVMIYRLAVNRSRIIHQAELDHVETKKLHELDEIKSKFLANISHEFRTPLMLILGPIKEALSQHPDPEARKRLLLIQRQARRLLDLVSQLLDLARLEQTVVRLQASKRNIVPILKALVLSFTSLAERRKISLTFQTDLEDIQVYVEKDAFAKIVNNLVANAFKFTSEGDQIQVLVSVVEEPEISPAGVLQIDVVDTGLGIPRESQAHIFDRFFQSAQKHAPGKSSYGIGLALTKELVELHKGKILVESCEDLGSTFTVLLPLGNEHLSKDEMVGTRDDDEVPDLYLVEDEMADVEPIARSEGSLLPRILIVEDNQDVSNFIRSYLNKDFRCFEANNGSQALEMIHEQRFELIISDIMMPVMDGVELCQNIKSDQNTSHIPVILITAKADLSSKIEGLETGADDYLTKPFEAEELVQRAKNLIQQRQALRERFQREIALIPDDLELSSMDQKFIKNAMHLLSERMGDHNFSVNKFANEIHMSRQHLNRKLKAITGLSALEFIRSQRLKRAALLFRNEKATVTEIAFQVGFSNPSHFSRAFQGEFGLTPSKYLKRQRSLNSEA